MNAWIFDTAFASITMVSPSGLLLGDSESHPGHLKSVLQKHLSGRLVVDVAHVSSWLSVCSK